MKEKITTLSDSFNESFQLLQKFEFEIFPFADRRIYDLQILRYI